MAELASARPCQFQKTTAVLIRRPLRWTEPVAEPKEQVRQRHPPVSGGSDRNKPPRLPARGLGHGRRRPPWSSPAVCHRLCRRRFNGFRPTLIRVRAQFRRVEPRGPQLAQSQAKAAGWSGPSRSMASGTGTSASSCHEQLAIHAPHQCRRTLGRAPSIPDSPGACRPASPRPARARKMVLMG